MHQTLDVVLDLYKNTNANNINERIAKTDYELLYC